MADGIVDKFGGSSITSPEDIKRIEKIINDDLRRNVIVVSAPGKKDEGDTKVTDMLIELAKSKDSSLAEQIINRYHELWPPAEINKLSDLLHQKLSQTLKKREYLDSMKAFGEEACALIVSEAINGEFVDPKDLFLVSEDYGNAKILPESAEMIKKGLGDKDEIFIVPGFYGYTKSGKIATFSRGGSDLSGAYIAAALNAKIYENFTDIDGVFAANPDIVKNPKKIDEITYNELRDLAYSGFGIFHEEAMKPIGEKRIPVHIRNAFKYPKDGTFVVHDRLSDSNQPIVGVAYRGGLCSFDIEIFGLNAMYGIGRRLLQVFEEEKISVEFVTTGIDDLSIIIGEDKLRDSPNYIGEITNKLHSSLEESVSTEFQDNLGSLVVSGKGLKGTKGISAKIQQTLADADVNIRFISQGPAERCIIYGINRYDSEKAVNAIYDGYLR